MPNTHSVLLPFLPYLVSFLWGKGAPHPATSCQDPIQVTGLREMGCPHLLLCWTSQPPAAVQTFLCSLSSHHWERGVILECHVLRCGGSSSRGMALDSVDRSAGGHQAGSGTLQSTHPEPVCLLPMWFGNALLHGQLLVLVWRPDPLLCIWW